MRRIVKREATGRGRSRDVDDGNAENLRAVKRERLNSNRGISGDPEMTHPRQQNAVERRVLRSNYLALKHQINDERDELEKVDSNKFEKIIHEVENLHQQVQKPREQVADAEALLDIANTLVSSVKKHSSEGITPSDFVTSLLKNFGQPARGIAAGDNDQVSIKWKDIGLTVSPIFMKVHGCCTMLGPMNAELKQKKFVQRRRAKLSSETARPDELCSAEEEKSDTDKNMAIMFEILRRRKRVTLESLILNRNSFAQTVENLFALSFLVKDGRAEITVNENRSHFVSPRNAPAAHSVMSGEVSYSHFVFRFDFNDWKLMKSVVPEGEELMPNRERSDASAPSQAVPTRNDIEEALPTTPIRKLTRNRGRIVQNESVVEDSPEIDTDDATRVNAIRKCKRKIR